MTGIEIKHQPDVLLETGFMLSRVKIGDQIEYIYRGDPDETIQQMQYNGFGLYRGELVIIEGKIVEYFNNIRIIGFEEKQVGLAVPERENYYIYALQEINGKPALLIAEINISNQFIMHSPLYINDLPELMITEGDFGVDDI